MLTALRLSLPFATLGLALGFLAAVGWRYTVPRLLIDTAPPQVPEGKIGYMVVINSLKWVTGPTWWPAFALLPAIGFATGLIVGILVARCVRGRSARMRAGGAVLGCGVVGALTGVAGAVFAHLQQPKIGIFNTDGPPSIDYNNLDGHLLVHGAPPLWDLSPTYLSFPVVGLLVGVATATIAIGTRRLRHP
ncbi:hypothetical protein [Gordonia sp. 'Campus']|uniref:hypothetical protein n=1 Tax=Gordonia sp. 'Campus' TaxID=2915824 RepID=UPI001EE3E70F|nr:hypothetical protein [Gordonia sp. 'Campus']